MPNADVAAQLPPGLIALGRTLTADQVGSARHADQHRQEQLQPARRLRVAARREQQDRPPRRRSGSSIRPSPSRASAICSRPTSSATSTRAAAARSARLLRSARRPSTSLTSATRASTPISQSPDIYQYNLTLERELPGDIGLRVSYIGSTMRKLLVDRDYNTLQASTVPFDPEDPADYARACRSRSTATSWTSSRTAAAGSSTRRSSSCCAAGGAGWRSTPPTRWPTPTATRPIPATARSGRCMFDPYDIEKDRGPDPNVVKHRVVANATWDIPVGHGRAHGANMARWADALFGGWTVSTIFQARSGQNLTPFFTGFYTTSPWNTGKPLDGLGNAFCERLAAGSDRRSEHRRLPRCVLRSDGVRPPATGQAWQREEGQPEGTGHVGRELRVLQGRAHAPDTSGCSSRRCSTTRSTIRSSSRRMGAGSSISRRILVDGDPHNGTTGVLGADSIGNSEGFSPGRVLRLGLRARF